MRHPFLAFPAMLSLFFVACGEGGGDDPPETNGGAGGAPHMSGGMGGLGGSGPAPGIEEAFRVALSVSPFTQLLFDTGISFNGASHFEALQNSYIEHGATELFARVSTREHRATMAADRSLAGALERATMATALDLPVNVELSLFRSYGDVLCQTPPDFSDYEEIEPSGPWHTLNLVQMTDLLRQYSTLVAERLLATGARIHMWNLGNEVDYGTAGVAPQPLPGACDGDEGTSDWYMAPDAVNPAIGAESLVSLIAARTLEDRIAWLEAELWPSTAQLLAAAADGVRSVDPSARFSTHISTSYEPAFAQAFYRAMFEHGFEPDQLGVSFYPSAANEQVGATERVQALRETVQLLETDFDRPIFIAEFAYPAHAIAGGPFTAWNHEVTGYPFTETGQANLMRDLVSWAAAHRVAGLRPWAPDLVEFGWEPFALFEREEALSARPRAALKAISEGLAAPRSDALP